MNFLSYSEYRPPFRTPAFLDSLDSSNPCFSASPLTVRKAQKQLRTVTAFTPTTHSLRPRVLHPCQTAKLATASPNTPICEALPGNLQSLKPHYLSNLYPFKLSSSTFPSSGRILGQNSFSPPPAPHTTSENSPRIQHEVSKQQDHGHFWLPQRHASSNDMQCEKLTSKYDLHSLR